MKIKTRILLINFVIVALIIASSAFAFYSIMYNVLSSQQSKYLLNSANDLIYAYRDIIQETEDDFLFLYNNNLNAAFSGNNIPESKVDFIFETVDEKYKEDLRKVGAKYVSFPEGSFSVDKFLSINPYAILKSYDSDNKKYYYGKILTPETVNSISKEIGSEIAVLWDKNVTIISNESINQKFFHTINKSFENLNNRNNFDIHTEESETADIIATIYKPSEKLSVNKNLDFIIFTSLSEVASLRSNLTDILLIIGISGIILAIILNFVFTDNIRKNITKLSKATQLTKEGNLKNRISINSKDELGELAGAFNGMLNEIEKNQKARQEYSEFITLLNQNPTLNEISDAALTKIIKSCGFSVGALYSVDNNTFSLLSTYGLKKDALVNERTDLFETVIKDKEPLEIYSEENLPVVSTGFISLKVNYMLILPIIYNNKIIALLELSGLNKPGEETKDYLSKIQEQLAIGLTNATAFVQMENLVEELKKLNEDYQKQNIQVRKQNEKLIDLHKELKDKADELEVQKQKAEEATKLKSQFLASMSHELRTPMNSILGLTELILEEKSIKGKNRERIEVVLKSSRRLMNLINDILDLSKIEAGKMELSNEDVQLEELIKEVETSISPLVLNKGIDFETVRETNTNIIVNTDRGKVVQVLINLLGNAVKFTDEGAVKLKVRTEDKEKIFFDVIDTGIGISEEDQKLIFEEFRQVDGTTTRKYGGTGLGLAICNKIAKLMEGSISLESEKGKGSKFTFQIPLNFVGEKETTQTKTTVNVEELIKNRKHPVLVIDDDPEIRYTIGQYLSTKGYEVVYAEDGEEGVEKAKEHQPFAITLDIMLPKKNGWAVLKELKENEVTKDIPVILISIISDKQLGYGLGAYEYFVKPISSDKLISAFNKLESYVDRKIEKIVLVDDDELEFEKFKREFKNEDLRIHYIQDSELAFSKIREIQPDLIIIDLMMPKIDGITLSHKLKSDRETRNIPIIISTAKDLSEEEISSLNDIVEDITVKSKGHPLDVLKVLRDRLSIHEKSMHRNIKTEDVVEIEESEDAVEGVEEEITTEAKGRVLIVDDDPDTLFTIDEIVKSCNFNTELAKNGQECLEKLEEFTPNIILLDIMMPELDGFQTLKKIKADSRFSDIPVFAVTAKAMVEDKGIIFKHGFDDYIPKPVNAGMLAFKIEKAYSKLNIN